MSFAKRAQSEPLYRRFLAAMSHEELDIELRCTRWVAKTAPNGRQFDVVWKLDCLKDEFTKRGQIPAEEGFD